MRKGLVAIEMHDERRTSRTDHTKEDATVSDHRLTILNHADENEFIGSLISWQQFSLEELLEGPPILALINIEDCFGIWLEPIRLPSFHDKIVEH